MKRLPALLLSFVAVILLTACNAATPPVDTAPTTTTPTADTTAATTVETTVATTVATTAAPADTVAVSFGTSELDHEFTLSLPNAWIGHFAVREAEDSVTFYELQNHQYNGQGKLFTIRYIPENEYAEIFPSFRKLGVFDGYVAVALFPTDVQYDPALLEPYAAMYEQVGGVLDSFFHMEEPGNG